MAHKPAIKITPLDSRFLYEIVQFAMEQIGDTIATAERNGASKAIRAVLERYRTRAADLLERLQRGGEA